MSNPAESIQSQFELGQRVHSTTVPRRVGTVKYVGPVEGHQGPWVGVDWDDGNEGKHDGFHNGVRYFQARSELSGSLVRPSNLSPGISFLEALRVRYTARSTPHEEDEMYVLSASNKRVSVELVGKDKIQDKLSQFDELTSASLSYMGVGSPGCPNDISSMLPNLKELDLTGNLFSKWKDVGAICEQLPALSALNLSHNHMAHDVTEFPRLNSIHTLVLNNTGITWRQVEVLKDLLPSIEELHLMGNGICQIESRSSPVVQGFESLRVLDLDGNCLSEWNEILKLSSLKRLEQLRLNKNKFDCIFYPICDAMLEGLDGRSSLPFQNLCSLLLGGNNIDDLASIDSLNLFPKLVEIRLSENPIADPAKGGMPRFVLIARLAKVEVLNGSEVGTRERKDSEIRYVRLILSKINDIRDEIEKLHPRFAELKRFHGIEDERPSVGTAGPQKMASGLFSVNLKCVGATIAGKPPLTKKLPATTTVGKLKILCENFFKLHPVKLKLYLQEEGSPLPTLLDDEMATLIDVGIGDGSTILIDEEY